MRVLRNRWIGPIAGTGAIALAVLASGATSSDNDLPGPTSQRSGTPQTPVAARVPPRAPVITASC